LLHTQAGRQRRREKLVKAKQRLALLLKKSPKAMQVLGATGEKIKAEGLVLPDLFPVKLEREVEPTTPVQMVYAEQPSPIQRGRAASRKRKREPKPCKVESEGEVSQPTKKEEELDEEDWKIERCLLLGVSEALILDGSYELGENLAEVFPPVSHSEELGESDMADEELRSYILTGPERSLFSEVKSHWVSEEEEEGHSEPNQHV
jgi:hypothetical protein